MTLSTINISKHLSIHPCTQDCMVTHTTTRRHKHLLVYIVISFFNLFSYLCFKRIGNLKHLFTSKHKYLISQYARRYYTHMYVETFYSILFEIPQNLPKLPIYPRALDAVYMHAYDTTNQRKPTHSNQQAAKYLCLHVCRQNNCRYIYCCISVCKFYCFFVVFVFYFTHCSHAYLHSYSLCWAKLNYIMAVVVISAISLCVSG